MYRETRIFTGDYYNPDYKDEDEVLDCEFTKLEINILNQFINTIKEGFHSELIVDKEKDINLIWKRYDKMYNNICSLINELKEKYKTLYSPESLKLFGVLKTEWFTNIQYINVIIPTLNVDEYITIKYIYNPKAGNRDDYILISKFIENDDYNTYPVITTPNKNLNYEILYNYVVYLNCSWYNQESCL